MLIESKYLQMPILDAAQARVHRNREKINYGNRSVTEGRLCKRTVHNAALGEYCRIQDPNESSTTWRAGVSATATKHKKMG